VGLKAWSRAACFQSMGVKPVESNDAFLQELRDAAGATATVLLSHGLEFTEAGRGQRCDLLDITGETRVVLISFGRNVRKDFCPFSG